MDFSYIINNEHNPAFNLALEETLFEKAVSDKTGYLMLWINDPVVVVGRYQNTAEEVNVSYVREHGVHVVRRMTGGGAVYHDHGNLNYTVILPTENASVLNIHAFAIPLLGFLRSLGVDAAASGRNDVTIDGQKISGVAQYARSGIVLHHGTILFDSKLDDVAKALNVKPEKFQSKGFKSVRSRVTNVRPHLRTPLSIEQFRERFAAALIEFYGASQVRPASDSEAATARTLAAQKYATDAWVWGKSPEFSVRTSKRFDGGTIQLGLVVAGGVVTECALSGDFFSTGGVEAVESKLTGLAYPFGDLSAVLSDELLQNAFAGIAPEAIRAFFAE